MLVVGRRVFPSILWLVAKTGSRELFTLCVIAAAVGVAYGAASALRCVVRSRRVLRRDDDARVCAQPSCRRGVAAAARRFRGALLRLGGNAVRPDGGRRASRCRCWSSSAIIIVGKTLVAIGHRARLPLSAEHRAHGRRRPRADRRVLVHPGRAGREATACCRSEGQSLILAGAIISIALNPVVFGAIEPVQRWIRTRSELARRLDRSRAIRWPRCR